MEQITYLIYQSQSQTCFTFKICFLLKRLFGYLQRANFFSFLTLCKASIIFWGSMENWLGPTTKPPQVTTIFSPVKLVFQITQLTLKEQNWKTFCGEIWLKDEQKMTADVLVDPLTPPYVIWWHSRDPPTL